MSKIKIGLFGFGVVGEGLHEVLKKAYTADAEIVKICVKHHNKKRTLPDSYFTYNPDDILNDPQINLIVELIDDAEESYHIVKRALEKRIPVVTGNKKMLAYHLEELIELQKKNNVALLYDASACGSIPVIRNLEEYYDNDLLLSVKGILNGSSNFILSKIFNEHMDYAKALKMAQDLGFAESNPTFDVDGYDSLFKLVIITVHAFGTYIHPDKALTYGISKLEQWDINYALEKGTRIKLLADVSKLNDDEITMFVLPCFVPPDKYIYSVEDEFNGVVIKGEYYDKQFMFGRGAGGHPTGSSVLSDITARQHDYKYEYKKRNNYKKMSYTTDCDIKLYVRYHNEKDLELFKFHDITEKYWSEEYCFIVGTVKLADLIAVQNEIKARDLFIAKLY
ncbi:MAG TPA: homoserine dehydrogenase [Candidatus Avirikenella pullistercoris]|nr:homoserine dehydrogenase [Candidatus Avirikenella pullistercoris]